MPDYIVQYGDDGSPTLPDGRLEAPAFQRNHGPIWDVIAPFLIGQRGGHVFEAGSGTGQHVVEYARRSPQLIWWPSDYNDRHIRSIEAWRRHSGLPNIRPPQQIDLARAWAVSGEGAPSPGNWLAAICANVVHIAPWRVAEGLIAGVGRLLQADGRFFLYGPFKRGGAHTAPSNERFDASLRAENPEWGVRDVDDLAALARRAGLRLADIASMPANNLTLIFERERPHS